MRHPLLCSLLGLVLVASARAGGVTGRGGLEAVAVTLDGKLIAVGGQNRVVYLIAADTLEVKKRIWVGARIGNAAFNRDGTRLVIEDESDTLHLLDVPTGKLIARQVNFSGLLADPSGDQVVVRDLSEPSRPRLRRISTSKLEEISRIELEVRASAYRFEPGTKRLLILSSSRAGGERRVPYNEVPRELTGLARWAFRLKYDGLESYLALADLTTNKIVDRSRLWYTSDSDSTVVVPAGKTTHVLNRVNLCARISGDKIDLYETAERINHALGVSPDCKILVTGAIGTGTYGPLEGGKRVRFDLDPLPGQSEMFTQFAVRADGSVYGITSAYRLVRITREGKIEKVAAVY